MEAIALAHSEGNVTQLLIDRVLSNANLEVERLIDINALNEGAAYSDPIEDTPANRAAGQINVGIDADGVSNVSSFNVNINSL